MEYSTKVLRKHLTIFLLVLVMMLINMLVSVIFAFSVVCIVLSSLHYATYIYSVFTLFWIQSTNYYIFYTICANVTAVTYFLEDTQYMPASPLLNAIKRSLTVTFGASCFAGILTAIVETLEDQFKAAIKKLPCHGCCCCCCIVECIISCCVKLIGDLNKLGLFYSTVYGVPYLEGCRRFLEMKVKKFIDVFIGECILDKASKWNSFFITQFSTCCVLFAAWKHITNLFPENQVQSETDYFDRTISIILLMIVYAVLNWAVQIVLNQALLVPVNTTCFATMICFAEYPNRLKSTNSELYEQFAYKYSYATAKASGQAPPQQPQVSQVSINV